MRWCWDSALCLLCIIYPYLSFLVRFFLNTCLWKLSFHFVAPILNLLQLTNIMYTISIYGHYTVSECSVFCVGHSLLFFILPGVYVSGGVSFATVLQVFHPHYSFIGCFQKEQGGLTPSFPWFNFTFDDWFDHFQKSFWILNGLAILF